MTCLTCVNWDAKNTPPEMRRVGLATCALGPRWEFLPPEQACPRFEEALPVVAAARRTWFAKRALVGE